jgi:hypothetical protein
MAVSHHITQAFLRNAKQYERFVLGQRACFTTTDQLNEQGSSMAHPLAKVAQR